MNRSEIDEFFETIINQVQADHFGWAFFPHYTLTEIEVIVLDCLRATKRYIRSWAFERHEHGPEVIYQFVSGRVGYLGQMILTPAPRSTLASEMVRMQFSPCSMDTEFWFNNLSKHGLTSDEFKQRAQRHRQDILTRFFEIMQLANLWTISGANVSPQVGGDEGIASAYHLAPNGMDFLRKVNVRSQAKVAASRWYASLRSGSKNQCPVPL